MNIEALLRYQEKDGELLRLERQLQNSESRKKLNECKDIAKKAMSRSSEIEALAKSASDEFKDAQDKIEQNRKSLSAVLNKDITKLSKEELENLNKLSEKIGNNLVILEKFLTKLAEKIKNLLLEFNRVKKQHEQAKVKFVTLSKAYDEECKTAEPKIEMLKKELASLEKGIDEELFKAYMQRRKDNIFPVIVPIENKLCGRCRMELPNIALSKINEKGIITCEHCKRLNYKK